MELRGTLFEVIGRACELREGPQDEPFQLFVEDVPVVTGGTPALVCNELGGGRPAWNWLPGYRYVLMMPQVREILARWQLRQRRVPTPDEACQAVMFYSEHDRDIPAADVAAGYCFAWTVQRRRGEA